MRHFGLCGLVLLASLVACSGGDAKTETNSAGSGSTSSEDDLEAAVPVPLGLLDDDLVARLGARVEDYKSRSGAESPSEAVIEAGIDATSVGGPVVHAMQDVLTAIGDVMRDGFGPEGFFRKKSVTIPKGKTELVYRLNDAPKAGERAFAIVAKDRGDYPYRVEFYVAAAGGNAKQEVVVRFKPYPDDPTMARIELTYFLTPQGTDVPRIIVARLDDRKRTLAADSGPVETPELGVSKARLHVTLEADRLSVAGASRFAAELPESTPREPVDGPPFFVKGEIRDGDLRLFASISNTAGDEARQNAYLSGSEATAYVGKTQQAFDDLPFSRLGRLSVIAQVRTKAAHAACNTYGEILAKKAPGIPANVCLFNTSLSDDALLEAIGKNCDGAASGDYVVQLWARSLDLCGAYMGGYARFINPAFLHVVDGAVQPLDRQAAGAVHQGLAGELGMAAAALDLAGLDVVAWPQAATAALTRLEGALPRPD